MKNKMTDLRDHLFMVIEKIQDKEMDIDEAEAITHTAQVIVNSAKVEVDFIKANGTGNTGFIQEKTIPKEVNTLS